jgi:hypothetical protein
MGIRSYFQQAIESTVYYGSNVNRTTIYSSFRSIVATGGTLIPSSTTSNGYNYHVFTSPGTFTVSDVGFDNGGVDYFVIAGGGGGGTGTGGGGGAGGVRQGTLSSISATNYSITVGSGAPTSTFGSVSSNGNPSSFGPISATAGGRGASGAPSLINAPSPGGSGGGGMSYPTASSTTAGSGNSGGYTPSEGNPGGDGSGNNGGGGGGGAGGAGSNTPSGTGGPGAFYSKFAGPLIYPAIPAPAQSSWLSAVGQGYYAGGGGGSSPGGTASSGGIGGGGNASPGPSPGATSGVNFTGSGGGANWSYSPGFVSGGGGTGLVVVRYRSTSLPTTIGYRGSFSGGSQWFSPGYFGVEVHPNYQLINGNTYSSVTYRRVNTGSYYWWFLISQKTGVSTYTPVYGALIQTPSGGTTGETLTSNFSAAASTFGSATIPATGDYYISWLSTAPGYTAPTGSIYVNTSEPAPGGRICYVLTSTPPTTSVTYTTTNNNTGDGIHITVS